MSIYIKMQYPEETLLNAKMQFVQHNLVEVGQYVPNMRIVALGSVIAHQVLLALFVNALFVQQIHVNMVEPAWEVKQGLDFYVYVPLEEEELFVKTVINNFYKSVCVVLVLDKSL